MTSSCKKSSYLRHKQLDVQLLLVIYYILVSLQHKFQLMKSFGYYENVHHLFVCPKFQMFQILLNISHPFIVMIICCYS
ncbi:unnamed protein product [Schistosoma margrebowiei]|uniref:Uncharacterized protein n=1 Tax=Schistosoma margrebowiei TaxID=48269 RepID=A0A183M5H7_9TREM|nr:unnamed protein product [Schistosoma margrebowiei]